MTTSRAEPPAERHAADREIVVAHRQGLLQAYVTRPGDELDGRGRRSPGVAALEGHGLRRLPGGPLIRQGLEDSRRARVEAALLVLVGAPRLRRLGLAVPEALEAPLGIGSTSCSPSTTRYRTLAYNALVRMLVSFERAAEWPLAGGRLRASWRRSALRRREPGVPDGGQARSVAGTRARSDVTSVVPERDELLARLPA